MNTESTSTTNDINNVKIGHKQYTIEKPEEMDGDLCGFHDYKKAKIKIDNSLDQYDKNLTFIHEIIHGVCCRVDLRALNEDEHSIELLALGLFEAIKDNPHIFTMVDI